MFADLPGSAEGRRQQRRHHVRCRCTERDEPAAEPRSRARSQAPARSLPDIARPSRAGSAVTCAATARRIRAGRMCCLRDG